jgi:membrane fusion protein (multidrug efflux system)
MKGFQNFKFNKMKFFQVIVSVFVLIFLYSFVSEHVSCIGGLPVYKKDKKPLLEKQVEQLPVPVKAYKVVKVNFRDSLPALGSVKGFREFDLKFPVGGSVEYINFREGEKITQGDIIASLDQKEPLLKLEYAKIEYEKNKKLLDLGSVAESKFKQSQVEYQAAKAELDKTNILAFSDGYIGSVSVEKGSVVSPQDKIAVFVDYKDVFAEFGVIEKDISKVSEGQAVELSLDSYPDEVFKGQVDSLSPIVEGRSRTLKVRAKLSNADEKIKPGMFGRVNVIVYEKENALVIPSSCFKKKEDQFIVYVIHPEEETATPAPDLEEPPADKEKEETELSPELPSKVVYGTLEIRAIEVAYATPDSIELKEGLEEGELIMVDIEQDLQDKTRVEITETQEGIF